jgi:hypothetical protein
MLPHGTFKAPQLLNVSRDFAFGVLKIRDLLIERDP